jgi:hypothetical protein
LSIFWGETNQQGEPNRVVIAMLGNLLAGVWDERFAVRKPEGLSIGLMLNSDWDASVHFRRDELVPERISKRNQD